MDYDYMDIPELKIEYRDPKELIPYANNSRTHSETQINKIAASIKEFGFTDPIAIDGENGIIAGHGRLLASLKIPLKKVPTIQLSHLSQAQKKAYVIAHNRIAIEAGWDDEMLANEIAYLREHNFNAELTGFTGKELDKLTPVKDSVYDESKEDDIPEFMAHPKTKSGDIWLLGNHRLMCGDSVMIDDVEKLMNGEKADMVFTDPPYGINIVSRNKKIGGDKSFGSVGGGKIVKSNSYPQIIGDDSIITAIDSYNLCKSLEIPILIFWGGNYYADHLPNSSCWIVWDKNNTGHFADAELAWTNQKTAVRIFKHTWNGMIRESEKKDKRVHPTQKPIALAEWCFNEYGKDAKLVLDLFGGSGSTLIACEKTNRKCFMMEISPAYCDVIINRWQKYTGKEAILESTGELYNQLQFEGAA